MPFTINIEIDNKPYTLSVRADETQNKVYIVTFPNHGIFLQYPDEASVTFLTASSYTDFPQNAPFYSEVQFATIIAIRDHLMI
jgi:hypothetical protein